MGLQFFLYALVQLVLAAAGWWLAGVWGVVVALVLLAWLGLLLHNWQAQRVLRWLSMGAIAAQMPPVPGLWGQAAGRMRRLLREAAATAAASDARLHEILAALQASPNGVTLVDAQGRIEWCNHMAQSHFGVEPERDARQSLAYLLRVPEFNAYVAAQDFSEEVVLPGRDSSPERPIHISVQIFPYGDGRQLVLSRDITALQQAEAMRRDFVANVSHELRTPLTIIRGYTEALQDGTVTQPEQAQRFTKLIVGETERLERLISDLLDLSRLQAHQFVMELEMIPLAEVVDNVVTMLRGKYAEKGVELLWRGAEMIPPIPGNGDRLVQLMLILLDNALKYTQPQGRVQVELSCAEQTVTLGVSDDGAGIPAADLPFIWERFYKVDKAHTRENHGTGLGLSIAREIIERHGATVTVSSEPGQGTSFVLQFPVRSLQGQ